MNQDHKNKISVSCKRNNVGKWMIGRKLSNETKLKKSQAISGEKHFNWKGGKPKCIDCGKQLKNYGRKRCMACNRKFISGANHPNWVVDRSKLKIENKRNDSAYREWRLNVWKRDKFKCQINDNNCTGRIEAHHILEWSKYPELRYLVNNGITLCKHHHPKKELEVKKSINKFKKIIKNLW